MKPVRHATLGARGGAIGILEKVVAYLAPFFSTVN
ncbi:MAG: hypothetical protein KatS3mg105_4063 [Gemmatales bacterium]|nr:MAG: hypothetical protein KatS3mg105_4063 [Gemmatales bacterium]